MTINDQIGEVERELALAKKALGDKNPWQAIRHFENAADEALTAKMILEEEVAK